MRAEKRCKSTTNFRYTQIFRTKNFTFLQTKLINIFEKLSKTFYYFIEFEQFKFL